MKKIYSIAFLLAAIGAAFLLNPAESKIKSYYSGDAVNYQGQIYIGSVNTGNFEMFALEGRQIVKEVTIDHPAAESKQFIDLLFAKEGGKLYVYLVNGRFIYKYDVSDPLIPTLSMKIKDNSSDWTSGIKMVGGRLVTITNRGAKIWNDKYQIVDSYSAINDKNYGTASFSGSEVAVAKKDTVSLYSLVSRSKVAEYSLAVNDPSAKRAMISDTDSNLVYIVDDKSLKAINSEGQVVREFKHISTSGYDVVESAVNPNYLYFSDGIGIVKVDKETLRPVSWSFTTNGAPQGSWAMGLKVVADNSGDKIVIFNGSNILVLDNNLKIIDSYLSAEKETRPQENLSLSLDKNSGAAGAQVLVSGAGFGLNENVAIQINGITVGNAATDELGRFQTIVAVPTVAGLKGPLTTDLKVTGQISKLTYSTTFKIE